MLLAKQMGGGFWPPYESDDHATYVIFQAPL
jgi:hypothetical protein